MKMRLVPIVLGGLLLFANTACSDQLGGAKGNVRNVLTGQPVAGAQVTATTSTDIESEQRYKQVVTKTAADGSFVVKGLRGKSYSIRVTKDGFVPAASYAQIPAKSKILLDKPIALLPLPQQGPGFYVYSDKYIKLTKSVPYDLFNSSESHAIPLKNVVIEEKSLSDIPPMKPRFLIVYGNNNSGMTTMYLLNRHTVKENGDNDPEPSGEFYTMGGYHSQFAKTFGSIDIGWCRSDTPRFMRSSSDPNPLHFFGEFRCAFGVDDIKVFEISNIPTGYYFFWQENRWHTKENMASLILNYR